MFDYYCPRCRIVVTPVGGSFIHPHLGERGCMVCPKGHMVYARDRTKPKDN